VTRKRKLRQCAEREDADLEHLVADRQLLAFDETPAVSDDDDARRRPLATVIDVEHTVDFHARPDLLPAFARDRVSRTFVVVDKSPRETPEAIAGLDPAPPQHDAAGRRHDDGGRDLWIAPQHEVVLRTSLELATLDDLDHERRAALDAEVPHRNRA
jgi:hypothetical protein